VLCCHPEIATPSRSSRKVTSIDVARHAGVSQTTVSLVLSGKAPGRVSDATAEAVRRSAAQLGYRPNLAARALRSGTAATVGLVVRDATHPFFGPVLRGAQRAAWENGYVVLLVDDNYGAAWSDGSVEALRSSSIDGFVFFAAEPPTSLNLRDAPPVVLIEAERGRFAHVRLDVEQGADAALDHLRELGHRRIGYVRSAAGGQTFDRRRTRWEAHLRDAGEDPDDQAVVTSRFDADSVLAAGHALLGDLRGSTAVLCDDDMLAAGLLAAAAARGVRVPEELSVVGFDDLPIARLTVPALTTVHFDADALGAAAFELLLARIQGRRAPNRVLPTQLTVRDSTGPAPSG
jgi:DNA-binding LacI/PurR family transcriptional regulator